MPISKEQFLETRQKLEELERKAQTAEKILTGVTPQKLNDEQKAQIQFFLEAYSRFRPAVQQMLKAGEQALNVQDALNHLAAELKANEPNRAKEVAAGVGASVVGGLSILGHPFLQLYEDGTALATGKKKVEIATIKDSAAVWEQGTNYIVGEQKQAWNNAKVAVEQFDHSLQVFYGAYNEVFTAIVSEDPKALQKAATNLAGAMEGLSGAHEQLESVRRKHGAQLEQLNGFFEVSKEFAKDAAIEIAITVTALKALQLIGKGAAALQLASEKTIEAAGTVAAGTVETTRLTARGVRIASVVRALHTGEEIAHTAEKAHHVITSVEKMDHAAYNNANVRIE